MEDRDLALLCTCPLFSALDPRELGAFLARRRVPVTRHPAGSVVLLAGCRYEALRIILEGEAGAEMSGGEGRSVLVEQLRAPQAVATAVLFSPNRALPVSLVASRELRLASIAREDLLAAAGAFPPLLRALLEDMGGRLAFMADKVRALSFSGLRGRLADWLLSRARTEGGETVVRLETSKERLSAVFGVQRPSLSREFSELAAMGLVSVEGRLVRILDQAGLEALRRR